MRFNFGHTELESELAQLRFHTTFELLAVLQCTRWVIRQHTCLGHNFRLQFLLKRWQTHGQQLTQIAREFGDASRLLGILRIMLQQMAILFHGDAATRDVHDDGFHALFNPWPPSIDVVTHVV